VTFSSNFKAFCAVCPAIFRQEAAIRQWDYGRLEVRGAGKIGRFALHASKGLLRGMKDDRREGERKTRKENLRAPSGLIHISPFFKARVVKWQTRTFEGRMP
jgi:hypothetical protein